MCSTWKGILCVLTEIVFIHEEVSFFDALGTVYLLCIEKASKWNFEEGEGEQSFGTKPEYEIESV